MPSNSELRRRRDAAVPKGLASTCDVYADRAENAEVWDAEGDRYIDFAGGAGALNTGHRHPKIVAAVREQEGRFVHTHSRPCLTNPMSLSPKSSMRSHPAASPEDRLYDDRLRSGRSAIKIARAATGRPGVIAFSGAFHGRTLLSMALTGKQRPIRSAWGRSQATSTACRFRGPLTVCVEGCGRGDRDRVQDRCAARPGGGDRDRTRAGGRRFFAAPFDFLRDLRAICDEHGILLICDEIQSGFGRTGKFFAIEHSGVVPDIVTTAKSLAGGYPLSGITGRAEVMDALPPGGLGSTYGGNPLSCAAALAVIDVIETEALLERSLQIGEFTAGRLLDMSGRPEFGCVGYMRGLGAMVALELVRDRTTRMPAPELIPVLIREALSRGLMLRPGGIDANVIRILVPLTVSDAVLNEGLDIIERSVEAVALRRARAA